MADCRSKSCSVGKMQIEPYYGSQYSTAWPSDLRSHSVSYASSYYPAAGPPQKLKKGKSSKGWGSKSWRLDDPEFQRKRRVASYRVYSAEGKVKGSFRNSLRWLKDRYTQVVYGWW